MKPLAVLRPEPGATATISRARGMGLDAFALPLFALQPLAWRLPDVGEFDGLLLTSANAVRCAGEQLASCRHLPVHAVGSATADAAREAGLGVATVGSGGVDALLAGLPAGLRLLHLCGAHRREPTVEAHSVSAIPVYSSQPVPHSAVDALGGAVALVHSPRAGARLAELVGNRSGTVIAAISQPAADACGLGWGGVAVAQQPDEAALLSLAFRLCQLS